MSFSDPYQAYIEGSVFSGNPMAMVIALYEGAIKATQEARHHLITGDVWARSKAINKGMKILTELLVSLNHEAGGEISANLKRIYSYLQCRLLDAHARKSEKPLHEAERLLVTLLDGWRSVAEKAGAETSQFRATSTNSYQEFNMTDYEGASGYGLSEETGEFARCVSAVF